MQFPIPVTESILSMVGYNGVGTCLREQFIPGYATYCAEGEQDGKERRAQHCQHTALLNMERFTSYTVQCIVTHIIQYLPHSTHQNGKGGGENDANDEPNHLLLPAEAGKAVERLQNTYTRWLTASKRGT